MARPRKNRAVQVYLTDEEYEFIREQADKHHTSMAGYILNLARIDKDMIIKEEFYGIRFDDTPR